MLRPHLDCLRHFKYADRVLALKGKFVPELPAAQELELWICCYVEVSINKVYVEFHC